MIPSPPPGRRPMTADEKREFDSIFNEPASAQGLAPERLADHCSYLMEITISLPKKWPKYAKLNLEHKKALYVEFWALLLKLTESPEDAYHFEYDDPNFPHLHGYISYKAHPAIEERLDLHLREFARVLYLELPKNNWHHFKNAKYESHICRFKTPAICLNLKDKLDSGWERYIKKRI